MLPVPEGLDENTLNKVPLSKNHLRLVFTIFMIGWKAIGDTNLLGSMVKSIADMKYVLFFVNVESFKSYCG